MSAKKLSYVQGTPEWHKWRKDGIGSSDMAVLLNKSPYKTARDLYCEKQGFGEIDNGDKEWLFQKGHEVEKMARELFKKQKKLEMSPACFEKDEIFRASLDGYDEKEGVFEAKFTGAAVLKKAKQGEIPEHHKIQIQHQLFTSESDKAFWCGHDSKKTGVIVEVGRDDALIKTIVDEAYRFMEMLEKNQVPELSKKDTLFIIDQAKKDLVEKLKKLKAQKDEIEEQYKIIEEQVKGFATHNKVLCGDVLITEIERKGSVDYKKLPELKDLTEEYLENYRKASSVYKKITFKGGA